MIEKKKILLLGAGHAHIQILHLLAHVDRSLFELTLISNHMYSSYSGMIPGYLAGQYEKSELQFDLQKICDRYDYTFVLGEAILLQASENNLQISDGTIHKYDICSINIGIKPKNIPCADNSQTGLIYLKPISELLSIWDQILASHLKPSRLTIIGGGAAAFEIAVACRLRFSDLNIQVQIISGKNKLLHEENKRTQNQARQSLKKLHVEIIEGVHVEKILPDQLLLSDGRLLPRQLCLVGTSAEAPQIFRDSQLPINLSGFIQVDEYLNVIGLRNIFATGDCSHFTVQPLPKAGVYAVREGPILAKNIISLLENKKNLVAYIPQPHFLKILVSGKDQAIATYKNLTFHGWLAWRLKKFIDKTFMSKFQ